MIYAGNRGQVLIVDLTARNISINSLSDDYVLRHIGGRALASRMLYENIRPGVDPLGPENVSTWTVGPLNGTVSVLASKINVSTKSPLTNAYLDSGVGGHIASEMKFAGYDSILIKGCSSERVCLKITNDEVEIISAKSVWGLSRSE